MLKIRIGRVDYRFNLYYGLLNNCAFLIRFSGSFRNYTWDKTFKNEPSKICGRQSKKLKFFLKGVFHKFYLVNSWILCPMWVMLCILWQIEVSNLKNWQNPIKKCIWGRKRAIWKMKNLKPLKKLFSSFMNAIFCLNR